MRRAASSMWSLGLSGGNHLGYTWVSEYFGENGENGHVDYQFSHYPNTTPPGDYSIPPVDESWRRGQLLSASTYDHQNQLVRKTQNFYNTIQIPANVSKGYVVNKKEQGADCAYKFWCEDGHIHDAEYYIIEAGYRHADSSVTTDYFPGTGTNELKSIKTTRYDPELIQLRSDSVVRSDGSALITKYYYPPDYKFTACENTLSSIQNMLENDLTTCRSNFASTHDIPGFAACLQSAHNAFSGRYRDSYCTCNDESANSSSEEVKSLRVLQNQNNRLPVIESQSWVKKGTNDMKLVDGAYSEFKNSNLSPPQEGSAFPNQVFLWKSYRTQTASTIPENDFTTSHISNGEIIRDDSYQQEEIFDDYSTLTGKIRQYHKTDNRTESLIWGYEDQYPVVLGINISYPDLSAAIESSVPDLSALLEQVGDMSTTGQQTSWRNFNSALRGQPQSAQALITTYTYKPLVGITSITDPSGIATYYEYDAHGRLIFIRDQAGNITNRYEYHYKGQSTQ